MDRSLTRTLRMVGMALVLTAASGQVGCAKLKSTRQYSNQPVEFGTDFPALDPPRSGHSSNVSTPTNDLYASRFGRPKERPAESQPAKPAEAPTITTRSTEHPQVSLTPPVTLPVATDSIAPRTETQTQPTPDSTRPALGTLLDQTRKTLEGLTSYQVSMNHQERVGLMLNPPEDLVLSVRRNPKAVRIEWPAGPNKGREVIYLADSGKGLLHVHMPNSLVPVPDLTILPDSPLARRSSRHPINEAGFETVVENLEGYLRDQESGAGSGMKITYEGLEQPTGLEKACHKILRVSPEGEHWLVYIDPDSHLPALVQGTDGQGELIERFLFRDVTLDRADLATADAFEPRARWGEPKGLLQKLARASAAATEAARSQ